VPVGRAFGIPADLLPADLEAFEAYVAAMLGPAGPVCPGPLARELADVILKPPAGPAIRTLASGLPAAASDPAIVEALSAVAGRVPPAALGWLLWPSLGLLPGGIRAEYGLRWGPRERAVSAWLVGAWRAWNAVLPPTFRQMPAALAADRRLAADVEARPRGPAKPR
jgi:uncharacterized protein (DUF2236 family)